ncbi:hypothetical protein FHS81_002605 [Pseudochelatococcus contaminans]|uniref:Uncharacterized protein n=1 Tax=Pseudochelatococcus contaminans TaxID=1538103 RepID=A0A7W5Z6B4_9HYPH|nr:hypothetical protein [Pseudochelatococcus contaminans]
MQNWPDVYRAPGFRAGFDLLMIVSPLVTVLNK